MRVPAGRKSGSGLQEGGCTHAELRAGPAGGWHRGNSLIPRPGFRRGTGRGWDLCSASGWAMGVLWSLGELGWNPAVSREITAKTPCGFHWFHSARAVSPFVHLAYESVGEFGETRCSPWPAVGPWLAGDPGEAGFGAGAKAQPQAQPLAPLGMEPASCCGQGMPVPPPSHPRQLWCSETSRTWPATRGWTGLRSASLWVWWNPNPIYTPWSSPGFPTGRGGSRAASPAVRLQPGHSHQPGGARPMPQPVSSEPSSRAKCLLLKIMSRDSF